MKILKLLFLFFLIIQVKSLAQVTQEWVAVYSGPNGNVDKPREMALSDAGDIYICGESGGAYADWLTVKYNSEGDLLWDRFYNGPANDGEECYGIAVDKWGNCIVCGFSFELYGNSLVYTIAYDNLDGHTLWSNAVSPIWQPTESKGWDVGVDTAGNSYVTGFMYNGSPPQGTGDEWVTVSYQPLGVERWLSIWSPSDSIPTVDVGYALDVTPDGIVYMVGQTTIDDIHQVCTRKSDLYGASWVRYYDYQSFYRIDPSIVITDDEDVYVTAHYRSNDEKDVLLLKYNSDGDLQWTRTYNGPADLEDYPVDIGVDSDGNVIVLAQSEGVSDLDMVTIKYTPQGDTLWINRFETGWNRPKALAIDKWDNIYITGSSDITTIKYNSNGDLEWVETYDASEPRDIAVDQQGNVYVTGYFSNGMEGLDFCTIKYSQQTSDIKDDSNIYPTEFELFQNYPNSFNPSTKISWQLPVGSWQTLKVYDVLGNEIATLVNEEKPAGEYEIEFQSAVGGRRLASGIYFYQLRAGKFIQTKKMLLLK